MAGKMRLEECSAGRYKEDERGLRLLVIEGCTWAEDAPCKQCRVVSKTDWKIRVSLQYCSSRRCVCECVCVAVCVVRVIAQTHLLQDPYGNSHTLLSEHVRLQKWKIKSHVTWSNDQRTGDSTYRMTVSAVYRLTPSPPALVDRQKMKVSLAGLSEN